MPEETAKQNISELENQELERVSIVSDSSILFEHGEFSELYLEKSKVLSQAIDSIGFGKYQLGLFFVAGFGWFADNAWPIATSLILPRTVENDGVHAPEGKAPYITLSQNLGLLGGALFWSLTADIIGRKWAFNITFLLTSMWAIIAGSSPNFASLGVFVSFWSFGVGGNLPIDSAIFLENIPSKYLFLLTILSGFWALGQLTANLLAWGLISNFSCDTTSQYCSKADNKGWRYFLFTLGGLSFIMFLIRFFFNIFESPRFYVARGEDQKAIETLQKIARINGKTIDLTLEDLRDIDNKYTSNGIEGTKGSSSPSISKSRLRVVEAKLERYNFNHLRSIFGSRKVAISSILVIFSWAVIGLAFPLYNAFIPYYLETRGNANEPLTVYETYRNSLIVSVIGIPGAIIAGFAVELRIGRRGVLSLSLILTGVFLFASTTAKTSNAYLGWNCAFSFSSNIMYGVLYAYTPEIFPTKVRCTGIGLASSANRVMGVFAPIIAIYADLTTSAPIFVSGALFLFAAFLSVLFPYEPRGRTTI